MPKHQGRGGRFDAAVHYLQVGRAKAVRLRFDEHLAGADLGLGRFFIDEGFAELFKDHGLHGRFLAFCYQGAKPAAILAGPWWGCQMG